MSFGFNVEPKFFQILHVVDEVFRFGILTAGADDKTAFRNALFFGQLGNGLF